MRGTAARGHGGGGKGSCRFGWFCGEIYFSRFENVFSCWLLLALAPLCLPHETHICGYSWATKEMEHLPPVSSAAQHGGNGYRGPGAWKCPRKKQFSIRDGPLDLGRIIGNPDRQQRGLRSQRNGTRKSFKQGKAAALQARLESLSLALAPSYGVGDSVPLTTVPSFQGSHRRFSDCVSNNVLPQERNPINTEVEQFPLQQQQQQQPACGVDEGLREDPTRGVSSGGVLDGSGCRSSGQRGSLPVHVSAGTAVALSHSRISRADDTQQADISLPRSEGTSVQDPRAPVVEALRIPNAATKMSVDDRCTSEILGSQATIRGLLKEQQKLGHAMQRRRLEACLGNDGAPRESARVRQRRGKPRGDTGQRTRRNDKLRRLKGGEDTGEVRRRATKRLPHAHPLLFMTEGDVQKTELDQMRLEDAEATCLLKYVPFSEEHFTVCRLAFSSISQDDGKKIGLPESSLTASR